jgi:hypothetical protein
MNKPRQTARAIITSGKQSAQQSRGIVVFGAPSRGVTLVTAYCMYWQETLASRGAQSAAALNGRPGRRCGATAMTELVFLLKKTSQGSLSKSNRQAKILCRRVINPSEDPLWLGMIPK